LGVPICGGKLSTPVLGQAYYIESDFQSDNLIRLRDHDPTSLIDYAEKLELDRCCTSEDKSIITLTTIYSD
jgi:hypothetical protein